jgi:hypothetical protein
MPRYFFDTRDNGTFIEDDVGLEMSSLEEVKIEATRCLAEMARDVLPGSVRRDLAVEVRHGATSSHEGPVALRSARADLVGFWLSLHAD